MTTEQQDIKPGDILYRWRYDSGMVQRVVLCVRPNGDCQVIMLHEYCRGESAPVYDITPGEGYHRTAKEAFVAGAKEEIENCTPVLEYVRKVLAAAENGDDLTEFSEGYKKALDKAGGRE